MLLYCETSQNPLVLLQRQKLVKIKHAYLNMKVKNEETTKDLVLIFHNNSNQRLNLLLAKKLRVSGDELLGEDLSIVSYLNADQGFDPLIIENQSSMTTAAPLLSAALKRNRPRLDINSLDLKMLQIKASGRVEIFRRLSLSLAVFSFTLIGCAFGIEQGRQASRRNLFAALLLTLLVLVSYLLGKGIKEFLILGTHPFTWGCSLWRLRRISRGLA
jgi:lipopolysaccharide export system permease protein